MALESTKDFDGYLDTYAHGVTGIFFEVQTALFDQRTGFIDTWFDIDTGDAIPVNLIIDQEYFDIAGASIDIEGFTPRALVKATDVPYVSQDDKLLINEITTNKGNVLTPATTYKVKNVQPDNTGFVELILEKQ